ncbi:hypothetical protein BpHYR1_029373 [Brachionus plicatilis]|uniref:Uncharacterized protein n=1 Tax=Brachionus plicatilis TaxID=10195 RepID=A0A3M7PAG6_BRAPC|nr:hypothetical protein BpHYR1_029373 [Brachionus plicatilis]
MKLFLLSGKIQESKESFERNFSPNSCIGSESLIMANITGKKYVECLMQMQYYAFWLNCVIWYIKAYVDETNLGDKQNNLLSSIDKIMIPESAELSFAINSDVTKYRADFIKLFKIIYYTSIMRQLNFATVFPSSILKKNLGTHNKHHLAHRTIA